MFARLNSQRREGSWRSVNTLAFLILLFLGGCGNRESEAIESVLQADNTTTAAVASVAEVVQRMRAIDLSECPKDFTTAYVAHIHAWEQRADVEQQAIALDADFNSRNALFESVLRGVMGDPFGKAREGLAAQNEFRKNYDNAQLQIAETFRHVEEVATAYGVALPQRDPISQIRYEDLKLFPAVFEVERDSIAASVGMKPNDIVLAYDGVLLHTETTANDELARAIKAASGRSEIPVRLYRTGKIVTVYVRGGTLLGIRYRCRIVAPNQK